MDRLEKLSRVLNRLLLWTGGLFLVAMVLLTCANIFLRIVWLPVPGTYELMGYFGAIVTAFALGYTQLTRGHIAVDVLVSVFPARLQRFVNGINSLVCLGFFVLVAWQLTRYAATLRRTGELTETLRIIYYPFTWGVALGCVVLALVFLTEFLKTFCPGEVKKQ